MLQTTPLWKKTLWTLGSLSAPSVQGILNFSVQVVTIETRDRQATKAK
jgi:hypothetical protein